MRLIGYVHGEASATAFSDFLYAQGVKNEIEADKDDRWALWVQEEEQVEPGKALLTDYLSDPGAARFRGASGAARERKQRERREDDIARKKTFDRRKLFPQLAPRCGKIVFALVDMSRRTRSPTTRGLILPGRTALQENLAVRVEDEDVGEIVQQQGIWAVDLDVDGEIVHLL